MWLSVVIPAYNEEKRIKNTILEIGSYLAKQNYDHEIIVVNDGSRDKTAELVEQLKPEVKNLSLIDNKKNHGKGFVVRQGLLAAKGKYRLFTDADNSTPISELGKFFSNVDRYDIIIGSRAMKDSKVLKYQPPFRRFIGLIYKFFVKIIAGTKDIRDTQCGFKMFSQKAAENILPRCRINGFAFDAEVLIIGGNLGYKIKEVPIVWKNDPETKAGPIKTMKMAFELLAIGCNRLIGRYRQQQEIFMPKDHMDELYNSPNFLVRFVHNQRLKKIVSLFPICGNKKILDAGCGEGHLILKLKENQPNARYFGSDITEVALKSARERCTFADFKNTDITQLDFPDEYFDVVVASEVIEHVKDYKKAIQELKRVTKKEGRLIISFPNEFLWTICRFFLGRRPIKVPDHLNSFKPKTIKNLVRWPALKQVNLPFRFPFFASLTTVISFINKENG